MIKILLSFIVAGQLIAADSDIRVSSIGYLNNSTKQASLLASASSFSIKRQSDNSVAFSGLVTGPLLNSDTSEMIGKADFSSLTETGRFYVDVAGVGRSVSFAIAADAFNSSLYLHMLGFYGQRCGTAVNVPWKGHNYIHAACHTGDGYLDYVGQPGVYKNGEKGWHDAGDYGKYTVNAGISVGCLLQAWEQFPAALQSLQLPIPEHGGVIPDFLAEIKWETDWLLSMQFADGSVSHKLTSLNFDPFEMPESDLLTRYYVPAGSAATADFVATLAKAARAFAPYDSSYAASLTSAAKRSYDWLQVNPADLAPSQAAFSTGGYTTTSPQDLDDRLWAAAEWWETSGDPAALADAETRISSFATKVDQDWDWGNVKNLGTLCYLRSARAGKNAALEGSVNTSLISAAGAMVARANAHGYGRAINGYYWGSNGSVARQALVLMTANEKSPNPAYQNCVVTQLAHLYGRNTYNRSQVTGEGINPPLNPHHRPSGSDGYPDPWPGLLVGGGQSSGNWNDSQADFNTNEVAINWSAAMVYALASVACAPALGTPTPSPTLSPTFSVTPTPTQVPPPDPCVNIRRVNCGGSAYTDLGGNAWSADQAFVPGSYGYVPAPASNAATNALAVTGTSDPTLYHSERWGPDVVYRFYMADGPYQVRIKLMESYFSAANMRKVTIIVGGVTLASNLDYFAYSGGKGIAFDLTCTANASGGFLDVEGVASLNNASFMAIEVAGPPRCTPTITPTASPSFSASPTDSPSPTISETFTVSPTFSVSPTITETFSVSPTPTVSPTASPTVSAVPDTGPLKVERVLPCPNPQGGDTMTASVKLRGHATTLETRVYSPGYTLVAQSIQSGHFSEGWNSTSTEVAHLPMGLYFVMIRAKGPGEDSQGLPAKLMRLR